MKKIAIMITALALFCISSNVMAQTRTINKRQRHQQARIEQGMKSGELNRREAVRLEAQEYKIQHEKRVAKSDGVVTNAERRAIRHDQNQVNRRIYNQKHDAQTR